MIKKYNLSDEGLVREKVLEAIQEMTDLVGMTLGPQGRSVLIERGTAEPLIVDDGRRVAENLKLDDPIKQLAVRTCYSVTRKTDERAGDGTTTSLVLANAILKSLSEKYPLGIGTSTDVSEADTKLNEAKNEVIEELKKQAKTIKTEKDLINVATICAGDDKIGEIVGKMYWELGKEGHIVMEFNLLSSEIEHEIKKGYRFNGGNAIGIVTDMIKNETVVSDVHVISAHQKIINFSDLVPAINQAAAKGKNRIAIVARKYSESVIRELRKLATRKEQPFAVWAVRAPGLNESAYEDIAVYTGGKYVSEHDDLKNLEFTDLGHVDRLEITEDNCILLGGNGKEEEIKKRFKEVEAEAKNQKVHQFKQQRHERASALLSGVGVIRIGAPTDEERNWLKYKIEDAKHATKHAYQDGVVKGAGYAFKEISEKSDNILSEALLAPYEKLKANAGGKEVKGKNILDPLTVEIAALENACSAVSKLIRIGGAIAIKPKPELEEAFGSMINNLAEEQDEE